MTRAETSMGYHFYDLAVEFRKVVEGFDSQLQTYTHSAKHLFVASEEKKVYETLHERVASEIDIRNIKALEDGYSKQLVMANQELFIAEGLALNGKLDEAMEHLRFLDNLLK